MSLWTGSNKIKLLESGDEYYPELKASIDSAKNEIIIQVYIFRLDGIGMELLGHLRQAAKRGVKVSLILDGFGSMDFPDGLIKQLQREHVEVLIYRPLKIFKNPAFQFRRLHRKVASIDQKTAYVGGINIHDDQLSSYGERSRLDHSLSLEGPIVQHIHRNLENFRQRLIRKGFSFPSKKTSKIHKNQNRPVRAAYILRNNVRYRRSIEKQYLKAIQNSRSRVLIANAYFFPSSKIVRALVNASKSGVQIDVLVQGRSEFPLIQLALRYLYPRLLYHGIRIFEYRPRLLHSKVAVIDQSWSTVGSFNLDPTSLFNNLEANVVIKDENFSQLLEKNLDKHIREESEEFDFSDWKRLTWWRRLMYSMAYRLMAGVAKLFS